MLTFLDVGAHDGQTLDEVLKCRWGFDAVHAFEPMPTQLANLSRFDDPRLTVHPFGLSDRSGEMLVYGSNDAMEASIFPDKNDVDASQVTACKAVKASVWLASLDRSDRVIMKLNCEGAELPILLDLLASGEIHRIDNVMIDFDTRKVPSVAHAEAEVLDRMADAGFDRYVLCEEIMHGPTHQDRIANWLGTVL